MEGTQGREEGERRREEERVIHSYSHRDLFGDQMAAEGSKSTPEERYFA